MDLRGGAAAGVLLPAVPGSPHAPGRGGVLCGGRGDGADPVSPDPPGRPQAQPDGGADCRDAAGGHRVSGVCVCLSLPGGRGRGQPGPRAGKRLEAAGGHRGLRHFLVAGPAVYPLRHPGRLVGAAAEGGAGPCAADGHPGGAEGSAAGPVRQRRGGRGRAIRHHGAVRRCRLARRLPLYGPLGPKGVI